MPSVTFTTRLFALIALSIPFLTLNTVAQQTLPSVEIRLKCQDGLNCTGTCFSSTRQEARLPFNLTLSQALFDTYPQSQSYLTPLPEVVQTSTSTSDATTLITTRKREYLGVICFFTYCCGVDMQGDIEANFDPTSSKIIKQNWAFSYASPPTKATFPSIFSYSASEKSNSRVKKGPQGNPIITNFGNFPVIRGRPYVRSSSSSSLSSSTTTSTSSNRASLGASSSAVLPNVLTPFTNLNRSSSSTTVSTSVNTIVPATVAPLTSKSIGKNKDPSVSEFSDTAFVSLSGLGYSLGVTFWVPFLMCLFFYL